MSVIVLDIILSSGENNGAVNEQYPVDSNMRHIRVASKILQNFIK